MKAMQATDVRKNWGQFIDAVVHEKPAMVKRNRDLFMAFAVPHLKALTEDVKLHVHIEWEENGSCTAALQEIDLAVNAESQEMALQKLGEDIIDYANDYLEDFATYYHAPNRKSHFKYVIFVLIQDSMEEILGAMEIRKQPLS